MWKTFSASATAETRPKSLNWVLERTSEATSSRLGVLVAGNAKESGAWKSSPDRRREGLTVSCLESPGQPVRRSLQMPSQRPRYRSRRTRSPSPVGSAFLRALDVAPLRCVSARAPAGGRRLSDCGASYGSKLGVAPLVNERGRRRATEHEGADRSYGLYGGVRIPRTALRTAVHTLIRSTAGREHHAQRSVIRASVIERRWTACRRGSLHRFIGEHHDWNWHKRHAPRFHTKKSIGA